LADFPEKGPGELRGGLREGLMYNPPPGGGPAREPATPDEPFGKDSSLVEGSLE